MVIDIKGCAGNLSFAQSFVEGILIDDGTPCGVDEDGMGAHEGEVLALQEIAGICRERKVEGDDVRLGEQGVFIHLGDAGQIFRRTVVSQDAASEGCCQLRHPLADSP